jgi:phosphate transport system permease protein
MNSDRPRHRQRRVRSAHAGLAAHGEPWVWLTAGSLATALAMIVGLLGFIVARGAATFWPAPLELVELADGGRMLGEVTERERIEQTGENGPVVVPRRLLRTANQDIDGVSSVWVDDRTIEKTARPEWASVIERMETGRFHGFPTRLWQGTKLVADGPEAAWRAFEREHPAIRGRFRRALSIDKHDRGVLQRELRTARLAVVQAETARLRGENEGWELECETASGEAKRIPLAAIVRGWQPNRLSLSGKAGVYLSRWGEFLGDDPREANSAGGVFPAIWGTVAMTLIMSLLVAPFGVLAALYLREYASRGPITTAVRVAINNLAGVPSIVYGAFGLGFFCYGLGGRIDELFFKASLVADGQPTFGTGGLLWASLTLALLTLPVVIVATEEALAAVPNSMREGSYACGAGKWQTIRRIVLPRALPGIMTGLILAMARGAGEVAPLMLVGVKKVALDLPIDGTFPFVHPEREFMHLAYLIYDVGFQSQDSQAARPMVFTITLLLVTIIALLNVAAIWIRSRLRRRYVAQQF